MDWMRLLLSNEVLVFFGIIVGIPVIMGSIVQITRMLIRHRERMAMIERGMHPDLPAQTEDKPEE